MRNHPFLRLLLAGIILCALLAVAPLLVENAGERFMENDVNEWSGLVGMLAVGGILLPLMTAALPQETLVHSATLVVGVIGALVFLLVLNSPFDAGMLPTAAMLGAVLALVWVVAHLAAQLRERSRRRRMNRAGTGREGPTLSDLKHRAAGGYSGSETT